MNEVFIIGETTSEIEYKFIVNSKKYFSKAKFIVEIRGKENLQVLAYNELADFCYKKLKTKERIFIEGRLNTKMEIEVKTITIFR